jgi:hypothetical protein
VEFIQSRYRLIRSRTQLDRWRKVVHNNGTRREKVKEITEHVWLLHADKDGPDQGAMHADDGLDRVGVGCMVYRSNL